MISRRTRVATVTLWALILIPAALILIMIGILIAPTVGHYEPFTPTQLPTK